MVHYVIVLGGNGYFGTNLIEWISCNRPDYVIICIDRIDIEQSETDEQLTKDNVMYLTYDFNDSFDGLKLELELEQDDIIDIYNLAAESFVPDSLTNYEQVMKNNINCTLFGLKMFKIFSWICDCKLFHISTDEVNVYHEKSIDCISGYALSKRLSEEILLNNNMSNVFIIRPANIYGTVLNEKHCLQQKKCLINNIVNAIKDKTELTYEFHNQTRRFIHVSNMCEDLVKFNPQDFIIEDVGNVKIYNVKYSDEISIYELLKRCSEKFKLNLKVKHDPRGKFQDLNYNVIHCYVRKDFYVLESEDKKNYAKIIREIEEMSKIR